MSDEQTRPEPPCHRCETPVPLADGHLYNTALWLCEPCHRQHTQRVLTVWKLFGVWAPENPEQHLMDLG